MTDDHAGWPATPGLAAAVAIATRGEDAAERRAANQTRRTALALAHQRLGEAVDLLRGEDLAALRAMHPAVDAAFAALDGIDRRRT